VTISVLLITHEDIGSALLNAASTTLGDLPLATTVVAVNYATNPDNLLDKLQHLMNSIDQGQGFLILTDLFGSTPSNIAANLQKNHNVQVVAGLNLPMLIRVMNYPTLTLPELAQKAFSGGKDGVVGS